MCSKHTGVIWGVLFFMPQHFSHPEELQPDLGVLSQQLW